MSAALTPDQEVLVEAIAVRVVELLGERSVEGDAAVLVTPAQLAAELGVSRDFVYAHADELGAIRLGNGGRPRLWFDLAAARDRLRARLAGERSQVPDPPAAAGDRLPRRRRRNGAGADLLPIRGDRRAA